MITMVLSVVLTVVFVAALVAIAKSMGEKEDYGDSIPIVLGKNHSRVVLKVRCSSCNTVYRTNEFTADFYNKFENYFCNNCGSGRFYSVKEGV